MRSVKYLMTIKEGKLQRDNSNVDLKKNSNAIIKICNTFIWNILTFLIIFFAFLLVGNNVFAKRIRL